MIIVALRAPAVAAPAVAAPDAFLPPEQAAASAGPIALDLPNTADAGALAPVLHRAVAIRVVFPSFADGRGFSLGRRLRDLGFGGRLRAAGHLLPDQKAHALACGFDEIELDPALHARHGAAAWQRLAAPPPYRLRRPAA